ncbi:MAG: glycosyl hydrolase, partial [Acidobacteria bacterium]|nr:glycosyl hydrolase [Acidobacteriota bacterium]
MSSRLRLGFGLMLAVVFGLILSTRGDAVLSASQSVAKVDAKLFQGLRYRSIGPARGGRVTAVAGHRRQPHTFYMGATGGGVWKSTDAGQSWQNVSDGFFETASIGAIAVA